MVKSLAAGAPKVCVRHTPIKDWSEVPKFKAIPPRDWQERYEQFSAALVGKAGASGLNAASLAKVLRAIPATPQSKGMPLLPVAAESTLYQGDKVWIIHLRWEVEGCSSWMGHVREYYFTQDEIKQVKFVTCE
jgi:hypothetical protein